MTEEQIVEAEEWFKSCKISPVTIGMGLHLVAEVKRLRAVLREIAKWDDSQIPLFTWTLGPIDKWQRKAREALEKSHD